jgi:hypothetical protein
MKNPIILTLPRTGSTIITKLLFNIAHHLYGSKNYLNQYTCVIPDYIEHFDRVDGVIKSVYYEVNKDSFKKRTFHREKIVRDRIKLMGEDVKYTTKIFATDLSAASYIFFKNNFDFIFLERRDKISQLLSYCTMTETNKSEYRNGETLEETYFNFDMCMSYFHQLRRYAFYKRINPEAPVIIYEDFMNLGGDTAALQKLLNLPVEDIPQTLKIDTIPTPYNKNIEDLLVNKNEWLEHKPTIVKFIESIRV